MRWLIVFVTVLAMFAGCGMLGVRVKHHSGFMGPETWEATDGRVSVHYYRSDCWEAEEVLKRLAKYANTGKLNWGKMADEKYRNAVLADECWHVMHGM